MAKLNNQRVTKMNNNRLSFIPLIGLSILVLAGCANNGRYADKYDSAPTRPPTLLEQQDPKVTNDPIGRGNLPYQVFGKHYTPMTERKPFSQMGTASW